MSFFTKIFGGKRSSSEQGNLGYSQISNALGSTMGNVGQSNNALMAMLGLGGNPAAQGEAFDRFKDSTGYQFKMDSGISAIKGGNASRGLFNSGATGQALMNYGQNLADTTYGDYMDRLLGVGNQGIAAAGVLSDAGKYSKGKGSEDTGALGQTIGAIFASEPSLKTNIEKMYELDDGLGVYKFEYKDEPGVVHIGTMADEVENLRPWALGPKTKEGNRTVDYSTLGDVPYV